MENLIVLLAVFVFLIVREVLSFRERREMLDRLMAKSLPEYKDNASPEENNLAEQEPDDTVPIEEAEKELTDGKEE